MKGCFKLGILNEGLKKVGEEEGWRMKELGEEINKFVDWGFSVCCVWNWENKGWEGAYNIVWGIGKGFNVSCDYLIGVSDEGSNSNMGCLEGNENRKKEIGWRMKRDEIEQDIEVKVEEMEEEVEVLWGEKKEVLDKELIE